jgi:peroxiredoxin (alkyl hydroperoxide reductase subunit C)
VLVFYPFAFSPVCNDQLTLYEEVLDELSQRGATLYAISTDARWSQAAFKEKLGSSIRQLSDFEPKGATARAFGVLNDGGFTQRALVILDAAGVVKWSYQAPSPGDLPGANLIFDGLDAV